MSSSERMLFQAKVDEFGEILRKRIFNLPCFFEKLFYGLVYSSVMAVILYFLADIFPNLISFSSIQSLMVIAISINFIDLAVYYFYLGVNFVVLRINSDFLYSVWVIFNLVIAVISFITFPATFLYFKRFEFVQVNLIFLIVLTLVRHFVCKFLNKRKLERDEREDVAKYYRFDI